MAQLIDRDDLTQSIVNRKAKIPDTLQYRDFKAWLDGYTTCQHDILDIVRDAPAVARMSDRLKQLRYGEQEVSGMTDADDYDPCYECRGLGDDYGFDEDGELVDRCSDCPCNSVRLEELRYEMMDYAEDESEVSGDDRD